MQKSSGIIIDDKPAGWTSFDVIAKLRSVLGIKRIGHSGTLDPMATGVLPVFIGRATRAIEFCENSDKEYITGLRFGLVTDTQDITGKMLSSSDAFISAEELSAVLPHFLGCQKQIPPMYSAIKIDGKKLYSLARRGVEIERPPRDIYISCIEILECRDDEYLLRIVCSKGTYIRTLCHDIGKYLGCGGVMSSLRRIRAGPYTIDMSRALEEVLNDISSGAGLGYLIPTDSVFSEYPAITLSHTDTLRCRNGALFQVENMADGRYRFYGPDDEFILLGDIVNNTVKPVKSFFERGF